MKVLLLTQEATPNIGDKAIGLVEKETLESQNYSVEKCKFWDAREIMKCELSSFWGKILQRFPLLLDIFVYSWIKNKNLSDVDIAIIGGGALLSRHKGFNSALNMWTKILSKTKQTISK